MFRLAHFYDLWKANYEKVCSVCMCAHACLCLHSCSLLALLYPSSPCGSWFEVGLSPARVPSVFPFVDVNPQLHGSPPEV
jgi:hypothetical protein